MTRGLQLTSLQLHGQGAFDLEGKFPPVPANVKLWKGLFSDSLPGFIKEMDAKDPNGKFMINYLHVDCDLYVGALLLEQARHWVCLWRIAACATAICTPLACVTSVHLLVQVQRMCSQCSRTASSRAPSWCLMR